MRRNTYWTRRHAAELVVWNFPVCQALADPTVEGEDRCLEPWRLPTLETREASILADLLFQGPSIPGKKVETWLWLEATYQKSWPLSWRLLRTRGMFTPPPLVHATQLRPKRPKTLNPPQQRSCSTKSSVSGVWIIIFPITHSIFVFFSPPLYKQTGNACM